jgi:hypothetical protein
MLDGGEPRKVSGQIERSPGSRCDWYACYLDDLVVTDALLAQDEAGMTTPTPADDVYRR